MALKVLTLEKLNEFLNHCKNIFATQTEVSESTTDINNHLLNVDYSELEFDTLEIVTPNTVAL